MPPALVLAGGQGTRLRAAMPDLPKVLAQVQGRPFLAHVLAHLLGQGVSDVVLCVGYRADQVVDAFGDGTALGMRLRYSTETRPLGTGGALAQARELLDVPTVFALNGDSFGDIDLRALLAFHRAKRALMTLAVALVEDRGRYGSVVLSQDGRVTGFEEAQGGPGVMNAGTYVIEDRVLKDLPQGSAVSLEQQVLRRYVDRGLYGLVMPGRFVDIGTPEGLAQARAMFEGRE